MKLGRHGNYRSTIAAKASAAEPYQQTSVPRWRVHKNGDPAAARRGQGGTAMLQEQKVRVSSAEASPAVLEPAPEPAPEPVRYPHAPQTPMSSSR
jgi:hypothetical protein